MFRKNREVPAEAGMEETHSDTGSRRERPDFGALAQQRVEAVKSKTESRWSLIKKGFATARDFVLTLDARTAYRAGQAKDAGVAGAEAVGRTAVAGAEATAAGAKYAGGKAVEAGQAVGRGARATAEFGAGAAVAGAEAVAEGGKYVYAKGQQGAEMAMEGISRGVEAAKNKYTEIRTGITERYSKAKELALSTVEGIQFAAEQKKFNEYKAQEAIFAARAALSQDRMAEIQRRATERLGASGISPEESQSADIAA